MEVNIHSVETKFQGFFRLNVYRLTHSLFAGGMSDEIQRERLEKGNAAAVLLFDPERREVVMIEQFRIGALEDPQSAWMTELVAGFIEPGEAPEEVIRREAVEEAGCEFHEIEPISRFYINPASTQEIIHLYCARVDSSKADGIHGLKHEGEDIRVRVFSTEQAYKMIDTGEINSAIPQVALFWLKNNEDVLVERWGR